MTRSRILAATLVAGTVVLSACSAENPPTGAPSTETTATQGQPTSAASESAADVCGYLRGQLPTLRAIGSEVGVMANLTVNLFSWYEQQGAVPAGDEIDRRIAQECPEVGEEVLGLAGIKSFATL